ncbi:hypothetical protein F5Y13DRAFT_150658 [Hypoxylon sp. FL1857]|nr:hypothetical protein F5Y13DRAFT_150658 [Hypoxylon sp. FL1857]
MVNLAVLMALNGEPGWICLTCCNADILLSVLVIQWVTSRDNPGAIDSSSNPTSSPDKHQSYRTPPPPPPPAPLRSGPKLSISLPLKTTSTSQYEHIFGDLDPETDVVSAGGTSANASRNNLGPSVFDYDTDYDNNVPSSDHLEEEDIGAGTLDRLRNGKGANRTRANPNPLAGARIGAGAGAGASARPQTPTPRKGRESPSVSAALAADLERIRRYRGRRQHWSTPTPTSTSTSTLTLTNLTTPRAAKSTRRAPAAPHSYHISQLAFEGEGEEEDSRWTDLAGLEEERSGEQGGNRDGRVDLGGWI